MSFDKNISITTKCIIILCASYIHTSLHAKTNEPSLSSSAKVLLKKSVDHTRHKIKLAQQAETQVKPDSIPGKEPVERINKEDNTESSQVDENQQTAQSLSVGKTQTHRGSRQCDQNGCIDIVYGQKVEYEYPLGTVVPIRVVFYNVENKLITEKKYYGWDMNHDLEIDMLEQLDDDEKVVLREFDFDYDGSRDQAR